MPPVRGFWGLELCLYDTRESSHLPVLDLLGVHIRQDGLAGPGHSRPPADTAGPGSPRLRLVLRVGVLETGQAGAGPVKHRTSVKYL